MAKKKDIKAAIQDAAAEALETVKQKAAEVVEDLHARAERVAEDPAVKEAVEAAVDAATVAAKKAKKAAQVAASVATAPADEKIITPKMAKIPEGPLELKWTNYKNHQKLVNPANKRKLDVIVIGTGLAGASAAASLAEM